MTASPFPPASRLAAYLRDSGGDEQELSVQQQEKAVLEWCNQNGYLLTHIFKDEATPGSSVVSRHGFQSMLDHFRSPDCHEAGIIVWKYSRFARDIDDAQFYRADLRRRGYTIHSLNDNIPTGPEGRFFEAAIDWMNQRFLDDLSTDVKRGLRHLVEQYGALPGTPPRGFKRQPIDIGNHRSGSAHIVHRWVPDPDLVSMVRLAFELRASGAPYAQIIQQTQLYRSKNCLPTFFSNRLYIGELHYGDLIIPEYCDPIIDQATWQRVQQINSQHAQKRHLSGSDNPHHARRKSSTFILSGLARCARCNSPLNGHIVKPAKNYGKVERWTYYACDARKNAYACDARNIPQVPLENAVVHELKSYILQPENLIALQNQVQIKRQESVETQKNEIKRINRQLARIRRQINNVATSLAEIGHSRALTAKLTEFETQETSLLAEIARLENLRTPDPFLELTSNQITSLSAVLIDAIDKADPNQLRQILHGLIVRIIVERHDDKTITGMIEYRLPPPLNAGTPGSPGAPYAYNLCPQGDTVHRHKFIVSKQSNQPG